MQRIDLDLDQENELIFKVTVEGTRPSSSRSRFLLETKDYSLIFPASSLSHGEISIVIPALERVIDEGSYSGTLEVIVDDRVFTPIKIDTDFKKSLKVVAEAVVKKRQETTVTADVPVVVNKKKIAKESDQVEKIQLSESTATQTKRPPQRTRIRPQQRKEASHAQRKDKHQIKQRALRLIERISEKNGVTLSEAQLEEVLKQYQFSKKKRTK